jgi:hypothetical protein
LPAAAINPPEDEYDAHELDAALLSRFTQATVVPDRQEWIAWGEKEGVHKLVLGFVASDSHVFEMSTWSNPRAWKAVSDLIVAHESGTFKKETLEAAITGTLGPDWAAAFRSFRKCGGTVPSGDDLLSNYNSHRRQVKDWAISGQLDKLSEVAHHVKLLLQSAQSYNELRNNRKQWKNLGTLLTDLPPDLAEDVRNYGQEYQREVPSSHKRMRR